MRSSARAKGGTACPISSSTIFPPSETCWDARAACCRGGQQQQLAIARALVQEPKLLLLDEPTEGLQPSVVEEIEAIIKRIHAERNCAVLLVEQNLDFVRDITQRFAILDTGQDRRTRRYRRAHR